MALAAGILLPLLVTVSLLLTGPQGLLQADPLPIEVQRRGVDVTVFSATDTREPTLFMPIGGNTGKPSPGMALVKDRRMVLHLQTGDNLVKFTDVAASNPYRSRL